MASTEAEKARYERSLDKRRDAGKCLSYGPPDAAEGCHAQADRDSVFVDFSMLNTMTDVGASESQ